MNKLNTILLSAIIFLFMGCEYVPSGENFVELTPPESNIPVEISLNNVNPSDTIYVYEKTSFVINIKSTKGLIKAEVFMDSRLYADMWYNSFIFSINPAQIDEGVHKLTVNAAFTSGTGSLAEMMGMEGYMGELSWNIRVIPNPENYFKLGYRINKDGFLEVFWDNIVPESVIERYIVHSELTQNTDITISDAKQKFFVDYGYVCGNAYYNVRTILKGGYTFMRGISINSPTPKISFENLDIDHLRVYWDKPFANGRFHLTCDSKVIASDLTDTTITIPQLFGVNRKFYLEVRQQNPKYDSFTNKYSDWGNFYQGIYLGLPNWELYAYNKKDNIIYTTIYDRLVALDATTLQEKNSVTIYGKPKGIAYGGKLATAPHNSTVAAMTGEETLIYTDSRFVDPIIISPLPGSESTRLSALTSNDRFFVVLAGSNVCKIFNTLTGKKITEIPFQYKTNYTFPDFDTVSEDGQYFCASSESGIEVFKMNGTSTNIIYTDRRRYLGAMFVPSQLDKLLLRVGTGIEIRQMPGFHLIQTLDVSAKGATLCNIDPASMTLLYYQNDSLRVCKINNLSETIFKIRSDETTCKMFNNKLLTYGKGGICFDINPYLKQSTQKQLISTNK